MKTNFFLVVFLLSLSINILKAQEEPFEYRTTVNKVGITVKAIADLETLDWEDIMSVFNENNPQDSINIFIEIRDLSNIQDGRNNYSIDLLKVSVGGVTGERQLVKKQLQEKIQAMTSYIKKN